MCLHSVIFPAQQWRTVQMFPVFISESDIKPRFAKLNDCTQETNPENKIWGLVTLYLFREVHVTSVESWNLPYFPCSPAHLALSVMVCVLFSLKLWGTQILKDKDHANCTGCAVKAILFDFLLQPWCLSFFFSSPWKWLNVPTIPNDLVAPVRSPPSTSPCAPKWLHIVLLCDDLKKQLWIPYSAEDADACIFICLKLWAMFKETSAPGWRETILCHKCSHHACVFL